MSNSSQDSDDSIEAQQIQIFDTGFHILLACVSFYCYDCLVTIDKEIHNVWSRKWNLTTWIFAANRYGTLALMILQILPTPDYTSCVVELYLGYVFTLLQFIVAALFTGLRAYALCERKLWVFLIVFGLSIFPFFPNLVIHIIATIVFIQSFPNNVCTTVPPLPATLELRLSLVTRISVIMGDAIVLGLTLAKTIPTLRVALRGGIRSPFIEILIRDGTFFFLALLGLNIFELLTNDVPALVSIGTGSFFLTPLNSIVISRFMLNLRQANHDMDETSVSTRESRGARFGNSNNFVGDMGETLIFGDAMDCEEDFDRTNYDSGHVVGEPSVIDHSDGSTELPSLLGSDIVGIQV